MSLFKNGNRRVMRLTIYKLASGSLGAAIVVCLGYIPSQDWMTPKTAKIVAFWLMISGVLLGRAEAFFDKTATMFKNHEITDDESEVAVTLPPTPAPAGTTTTESLTPKTTTATNP